MAMMAVMGLCGYNSGCKHCNGNEGEQKMTELHGAASSQQNLGSGRVHPVSKMQLIPSKPGNKEKFSSLWVRSFLDSSVNGRL